MRKTKESLLILYRRPINGDGFGVGYYPQNRDDPELDSGPCVYCAITPAWNNQNLARLAEKTKSDLVFAHVRASTAGVLSETNCHPFVYHTLMFMHNGHVSGFNRIKKRLADYIREEYFLMVQGGTDSEWVFALFLNCLEDLGCNPADPKGKYSHKNLRQALLSTIEKIKDWTKEVNGPDGEPSLLNIAILMAARLSFLATSHHALRRPRLCIFQVARDSLSTVLGSTAWSAATVARISSW